MTVDVPAQLMLAFPSSAQAVSYNDRYQLVQVFIKNHSLSTIYLKSPILDEWVPSLSLLCPRNC